jgi:hypothetical protein
MNKPESFEVAEYANEQEFLDYKIGAIKEIVDQCKKDSPSMSFSVSFNGNQVKLTYHSYEMHLPLKIKDVQEAAQKNLNNLVKLLKKEFKSKVKETLELKELKDLASYSVQKVSLNERYYFASWRCFELE